MDAPAPHLLTPTHARALAGWLRGAPLTLLFGGAGADTTALLRAGLLPLLRRRTSDLQASLGLQLAGAAQAPATRRSFAGRAADRMALPADEAELLIVVDGWSAAPGAQVLEQLRRVLPGDVARSLATVGSLATAVAELRRSCAARLLFVFDRFDDCLDAVDRAPPGSEGFAEDITAVANDSTLRAHFLLAVRDASEARLHAFAGRIDGYGAQCLRLPPDPAAGVEPKRRAPAPTPGIDRAMPDLDALLARVAASAAATSAATAATADAFDRSSSAPAGMAAAARVSTRLTPPVAPHTGWPGHTAPTPSIQAPSPAPKTSMAAAHTPADDVDIVAAFADAPLPPGRPSRAAAAPMVGVAAAVVLAVLAYVLWPLSERTPDSAVPLAGLPARAAPPAAAIAPTVSAVAGAAPSRSVDTPAPASFADELQALLAAAGDAAPLADASDPLAFAPGAPRLAVARYDALQSHHARDAKALNIVVPLAVQALVFVTRRDTPLEFIHQIAGRPIDAGVPGGPRARSAAQLHTSLFGSAWQAASDATHSEQAALHKLAAGSSAGVALVGAEALDAFVRTDPVAARRLKALRLDADQPSSRAALRHYLPLTLPAAAHRGWLDAPLPTLGVMSFVVTPASSAAADRARVEAFALALCRQLPRLARSGSPAWRQVAPLEPVPALWPYSATAARVFADCAAPGSQVSQQLKEGARS